MRTCCSCCAGPGYPGYPGYPGSPCCHDCPDCQREDVCDYLDGPGARGQDDPDHDGPGDSVDQTEARVLVVATL